MGNIILAFAIFGLTLIVLPVYFKACNNVPSVHATWVNDTSNEISKAYNWYYHRITDDTTKASD